MVLRLCEIDTAQPSWKIYNARALSTLSRCPQKLCVTSLLLADYVFCLHTSKLV